MDSFKGFVRVVEYFLDKGLDPNGGANTGMNAFQWVADRGTPGSCRDSDSEQGIA